MALEKAKEQDTIKRNGPSLGSFFERQTQQTHQTDGNKWDQGGGISDYIGWANQAIKAGDSDSVRDFATARDMVYDDGSTIATGMDDSTRASGMDDSTFATGMDDSTFATGMDDSTFATGMDESTFATGLDNPTHATKFDDGTIATNFDDDASINTSMTPRNDVGNPGGVDYYNSEQYSNYAGVAADPYNDQYNDPYNDPYNPSIATDGTQNPYGDTVINMPLEFKQEQGIEYGLAFGGEDGFDGPGEYGTNEMMHGGGYGGDMGAFGQNNGLGGFGMSSPIASHSPHNNKLDSRSLHNKRFASHSPHNSRLISHSSHNNIKRSPLPSPPLGGGTDNRNHQWGATPKSNKKSNNNNRRLSAATPRNNAANQNNEERNRPWSAPNKAKKAQTDDAAEAEDDGVVFRGWGETPKKAEPPPKRKNWFGF